MSMSRGCIEVEVSKNQWYSIVCQNEYDYSFNDYKVYGPHPTQDKASADMQKHECNPGNCEVHPYNPNEPHQQWILDMIK